jgi:S-ribosylhomocysteine lyase
MSEFDGAVPGAAARDCGNYLDLNLPMARFVSKKFLDEVLKDITEERLIYPE